MTLCDTNFSEFVLPLVRRLDEKNQHFSERYGIHRHWDWDPETSTLTFFDPVRPTLRVEVAVVGTTQDGSWEWSWANPNIDDAEKRDVARVREFGAAHGYESLTQPFVQADKNTGWAMTAVSAHVLNAPGAFHFSTGNGECYLLYRAIQGKGNAALAAGVCHTTVRSSTRLAGWDD